MNIDELRDKFTNFGSLEKIKVFCKGTDTFAHITFKDSRNAYFALLHFGEKKKFEIRLASVQNQPDYSLLTRLPNELLIKIFEYCNFIHDQAAILATCERFRNIMKKKVFDKLNEIKYRGHNASEGITTACHLLKHIDANGFKLSFELKRTISTGIFFYEINIDFKCSKRILVTDSVFILKYAAELSQIKNQFSVLHLKMVTGSPALSSLGNDYHHVTTLFFDCEDVGIPFYPLNSLMENVKNVSTICFRNLGCNSFSIKSLLNSKINRLILINCYFLNESELISSIIQTDKSERQELELIYSGIPSLTKGCSEIDVNPVSFEATEFSS